MLRGLDFAVIIVYLAASALVGLYLSGRQKDLRGYFLGNRDLPWWAVSLSVVATETSALTVISVPAVAYLGNMTFLQLALGYFIARVLVALVLLPKYYAGELATRLRVSQRTFRAKDASGGLGRFSLHAAAGGRRAAVCGGHTDAGHPGGLRL